MSRGVRWRDGLNSPQVDQEVEERFERRGEKLATLQDMLSGAAWQETCAPALARRMQGIATKLATDKRSDLAQIRALQAEYGLLKFILTNPAGFFGGGTEEGR